jgi:poly(A) polymerase
MQISLPEWVPVTEIKTLIDKLSIPNSSLKMVGGMVRDMLMGKISKDFDLITPLTPGIVSKRLKDAGFHVIPIGIEFGTIMVLVNNKSFEITTLRKDISCDGRYAEVTFTSDWHEDAKRRDFTINALSLDVDGNLYDYYDGVKDLEDGVVRFIDDANTRIKEDYLRILRYYRFCALFDGKKLCYKQEIESNLNGLHKLSGERIQNEMMKLLCAKFASQVLVEMYETNVLEKIGIENLQKSDLSRLKLSDDSTVNLAMLVKLTPHPHDTLDKLVLRWKLSRQQSKTLAFLISYEESISLDNIEGIIFRYGKGSANLIAKLLIHNDELKTIQSAIESSPVRIFPLNGNDLSALGYQGKEIGEKLSFLKEYWIKNKFKPSKLELLSIIK